LQCPFYHHPFPTFPPTARWYSPPCHQWVSWRKLRARPRRLSDKVNPIMSQPPSRPFESLTWYRDAVRNGFRDDARPTWSRWATGWGMLRTHLNIFAFGMVLMYALNLFFDADANWASWWIVAWIALIGIHAIVVTMLWVLRQWNDDAPDEPLFVPTSSAATLWNFPEPPAVQEEEYRSNFSPRTSESTWNPWQTPEPPPDVPESERASWSEASAAAWRTRTPAPSSEKEVT